MTFAQQKSNNNFFIDEDDFYNSLNVSIIYTDENWYTYFSFNNTNWTESKLDSKTKPEFNLITTKNITYPSIVSETQSIEIEETDYRLLSTKEAYQIALDIQKSFADKWNNYIEKEAEYYKDLEMEI